MATLDRKDTLPPASLLREITVEKLVYQGYGLAHHGDRTVFVLNGAPGDVVDVETIHRRGDVLLARIREIHKPSPIRISAPCEAFGECGGCDWLMLPYAEQLVWKHRIVTELLRPLDVPADLIQPVVPSPLEFHYRNKSYLPVGEGPVVGMYARRSHSVVPHRHCFLQPGLFDDIAGAVKDWITSAKVPIYREGGEEGSLRFLGVRYSFSEQKAVVSLVTRKRKLPFTKQLERNLEKFPLYGAVQNLNPHPGNTILGDEDKSLWGESSIVETVGHCRFQAHYRSFFQVNSGQAENLYRFAMSYVQPGDTVVDAFCGVGTFGIYMAKKAGRVIGIEKNPEAVRDAVRNATDNDAGNYEVREGAVENVLPELLRTTKIDTLLIDPPRKGMEADTITHLGGVRRIVYVSCNPATQVRDVRALRDAGFEIVTVQPFDMFPQTYHIENVMVLERA